MVAAVVLDVRELALTLLQASQAAGLGQAFELLLVDFGFIGCVSSGRFQLAMLCEG